MFMASYGIQLRSSIYTIQWEDYHKDHHEVMLKGLDPQTGVFTINLTERKFGRKFRSIEFLYILIHRF